MPLRPVSAPHTVFCRALDYDMFFKDLSNSRVSTDVAAHRLDCVAVFSRALDYDTFFSDLSNLLAFFRRLQVAR